MYVLQVVSIPVLSEMFGVWQKLLSKAHGRLLWRGIRPVDSPSSRIEEKITIPFSNEIKMIFHYFFNYPNSKRA
jgi:hypothetical protein